MQGSNKSLPFNSNNYYYDSTTFGSDGTTATNSRYSTNIPLVFQKCPSEWKDLQISKNGESTTLNQKEQAFDQKVKYVAFMKCIGKNFCEGTEYPLFRDCIDVTIVKQQDTNNQVHTISSSNSQSMNVNETIANKQRCVLAIKSCMDRVFPNRI